VRVAVDARKLFDGGIGTYIRETLAAMAALGRHELVALVDPRDRGRGGWADHGVREVPVRAGKYGVTEHLAVPRAARAAGADLLHAPHYTLPLGWSGPSVVTVHDLTHLRYPGFFPPGASLYARALASLAVRRARRVIVDSAFGLAELERFLGVPRSRVTVVPLGVSAELQPSPPSEVAAFRAARGLPEGYLLYVGARKRSKNLETLIRALSLIPARRRPTLVLSGDPWAAGHRLARLAARCGMGGSVGFSGALETNRELACLYSGCALYAQPSLTEGFGLPPLEAMACGAPVVSSTGGALPEVLGDAALLVPPLDVAAWRDTVLELLEDPARRATLVRRGEGRARRYTWEEAGRRTLEVYEEAAAGG
jgi:glycosyltransferase involved in cell wall biosynthesis